MAGSYFDMLTGQQGMPAKPFDPVEELKRLRRGLTLRMQTSDEPETVADPPPLLVGMETKNTVSPPLCGTAPPEAEPVSLETVIEKAGEIKKTLAVWRRSRLHTGSVRRDLFRGSRTHRSKRKKPSSVAQYLMNLTDPKEGTLETVNAGLIALGIVGVIFGVLSFFRGLESDLSLGSLVCATGAAIVVIGLGGRLLASR